MEVCTQAQVHRGRVAVFSAADVGSLSHDDVIGNSDCQMNEMRWNCSVVFRLLVVCILVAASGFFLLGLKPRGREAVFSVVRVALVVCTRSLKPRGRVAVFSVVRVALAVRTP